MLDTFFPATGTKGQIFCIFCNRRRERLKNPVPRCASIPSIQVGLEGIEEDHMFDNGLGLRTTVSSFQQFHVALPAFLLYADNWYQSKVVVDRSSLTRLQQMGIITRSFLYG